MIKYIATIGLIVFTVAATAPPPSPAQRTANYLESIRADPNPIRLTCGPSRPSAATLREVSRRTDGSSGLRMRHIVLAKDLDDKLPAAAHADLVEDRFQMILSQKSGP